MLLLRTRCAFQLRQLHAALVFERVILLQAASTALLWSEALRIQPTDNSAGRQLGGLIGFYLHGSPHKVVEWVIVLRLHRSFARRHRLCRASHVLTTMRTVTGTVAFVCARERRPRQIESLSVLFLRFTTSSFYRQYAIHQTDGAFVSPGMLRA